MPYSPFVAQDEELVAHRGGSCPDCTRVEILKSMALPPDFLIRHPFS